MTDVHSCSYYCDRPECIKAQRDELRDRLAQPDAYGYASRLAVAIWEQHYKDVAPQWKPLDDLMGVLIQIDNMTAGLTRLAQPEPEPDYWLGYGLQAHTERPFEGATPLYTTPPQRKPLTDEEVVEVLGNLRKSITGNVFLAFARAIEAAHDIKEKNT